MKPWEVIATLLKAGQLMIHTTTKKPTHGDYMGGDHTDGVYYVPDIRCKRTNKIITLENVRTIQIEHWPVREKHGGAVDPDNAIISLAEGHKDQTRREQKGDAKERATPSAT
jgi:hypothetical protein